MFMDIARLLCVTTKNVVLIQSESSMSDAITQSWKHLIAADEQRPKFVVCIYDGSSPAEFLVIAADNHIVQALETDLISESDSEIEADTIGSLCKLIQSKLPHSSKLKLPQPKASSQSPQHIKSSSDGVEMTPKSQLYFTDEHCRLLIQHNHTEAIIERSFSTFTSQFTSLDNFKNVKTMFIINDSFIDQARAILSDSDELHGITIFKNAVAGIIEEIENPKHGDTLWLFCCLNSNHKDYTKDVYQALQPLFQCNQAVFMFYSNRPYNLFCSNSPFNPEQIISDEECEDVLSEYKYGIESHIKSLSTANSSVCCSETYQQLVNMYSRETIEIQPDVLRLVTLVEHCYVSAFHHIESDNEIPFADYVTYEAILRLITSQQPLVLRTPNETLGQLAFELFNQAMGRYDFENVKIGIVLSMSTEFIIREETKTILKKESDWKPTKLTDFAGLPVIIIHSKDLNEFELTGYPLFSTVDVRLMLSGYFSRRDIELEFLLATSFSKRNCGSGLGTSTRNSIIKGSNDDQMMEVALTLQGMKRKVDTDNLDSGKRIKIENDPDIQIDLRYSPTKVILSKESFLLFQGTLNPTV